MASLPPQRVNRRQSQPEQATSPGQRNQSPTSKSVDSQTLFLNDHASSTNEQSSTTPEQANTQQTEDSEPRRCWICFTDETEDTPQNHTTWKSPCPCALTAHEQCLLDWIADVEAPQGDRAAGQRKELKCPQCKSEIHLSRPRSWVIDLVGRVEKLSGQLLLPTVVVGSMYTLVIVSSYHGAHSIRMIFGTQDAGAILAESHYESMIEERLQRYVPILARPFYRGWRGWRVEFGLPLIPLALIASRTRLADTVLPLLPILFFATHPDQSAELRYPFWPPSAALTFVALPYVRSIYDECMTRMWAAREIAWMKEIHPRLGGEERNGGEDGEDDEGDEDEADMVQLQIDIEDEVEDVGDEEQEREVAMPPPLEERQNRAPPLQQPPADEQQGGPNEAEDAAGNLRQLLRDVQAEGQNQGQGQQQGQQGQQGQHQHQHHHRRVDVNILTYATKIAETTVGALLFPTVSAFMGEALRFVLPLTWTVPGRIWGRPAPTGLLQTKWGRSIVGGCLFVVMKDAVRIYCRWKMAQSYRNRKVLNYDKKLGRVVQ